MKKDKKEEKIVNNVNTTLLGKTLRLIKKEGKELDNLKKFMQSPYFNTNKDLVKLFDELIKTFPDFSADKEVVFNKIYPKIKYNDETFRLQCSALNELIEMFLLQEQLKKNEFLKQQLLAEAYDKKRVYKKSLKGFEDAIVALEKSYNKNNIAILPYYSQKAELYNALVFHPENKSILQSEKLLTEASEAANKVFILQKLEYFLEQTFQQAVFKKESNFHFLDEIINYCQDESIAKEPIFKIYADVISLYKNDTINSLSILCENFKEHYKEFSAIHQEKIFSHIQNSFTRKINAGDISFYAESFDWLKFGLSSKLLLQDEKLSETMFLNIANTASLCQDFEWFEYFISDYKKNLHSANPDVVIELCRVNKHLIRFEKERNEEDLDAAMNDINKMYPKNVFLKLTRHSLNIKVRFHMHKSKPNEICLVRTEIDRFKSFVKNEKTLSENRKNTYFLYLSCFCEMLTIFEEKHTKSELKVNKRNLINKINEASFGNKHWLIANL